LTAEWDFNDAYAKGNSLKISGNLPADTPIDLMLFKTKLNFNGSPLSIDLMYKSITNNSNLKVLVVYADEPNQKYELPLFEGVPVNGWKYAETSGFSSSLPEREIAVVGLRFKSITDIANYEINIGEINIGEYFLSTSSQSKDSNYVIVSYPNDNSAAVLFNINWPNSNQIKYTVTDLQGKNIVENNIALNNTTTYSFSTNGLAKGTYIVKFTDKSNKSVVQKITIN
jgi:hypothetical protein